MKKRLILSTLSLIAAGFIFIGCKGDDGAVGPAGAKGDTGAQGTAGTKGDKGDTGTANVIYSEWKALSDTAVASTFNRKNYNIAAPEITQNILDKGFVYAYVKTTSSVIPLPYVNKYVYANQEVAGSYITTVIPHVGRISLNQDWMTPGAIPPSFADTKVVVGGYTHLRYVIIPGGLPAGRISGVDFTDYEAVKKFYNLAD
jgi:hypothetical protein